MRRRWLRRAVAAVCLIVVVGVALSVPIPYFLERPGSLLSLGGCVSVGGAEVQQIDGEYLLTTVNLRRASLGELAYAQLFEEVDVVPAERLVREGQTDREYFARQREVFSQAATRAAAVGLAQAGFEIPQESLTGDGALVLKVVEGTPAEGVLQAGDLIKEVDGEPVRTSNQLRDVVNGEEPLDVRFVRDGRQRTVEITPRETEIDGEVRPVIGVLIETYNERIELPVPVEVESGRIGGPSAGLMIALTVYDKVNEADLAGGRRVAGTGTIAGDGDVGPIGGIDLKAVSAERAGADVFLAPARQVEAARSRLPSDTDLVVVPVDTFEDAVAHLREMAPEGARGAATEPRDCAATRSA